MQEYVHLSLNLILVLTFAIAVERGQLNAQETDPEVELLRHYVEQAPQAQLRIVAGLQSQADKTVAPYMQNPVLVLRQEQAIGPGDGFSTSVVGAEFVFDIAGRHELRSQTGQVRSGLHRFRVQEQLLQQVCVVREAVLELDSVRESLAVLRRIEERYEWLLESVKALAAGEEKSRFDVRRVALKLTAHGDKVRELSAKRAAIGDGIGAIVGGRIPEGLRSQLEGALPELGGVLTHSESRHPAMAAARVLKQVAGLEERMAKKSWIPDLGLYGAYRLDAFEAGQQPLHGYELGFSLELPFFRKGKSQEAQATASTAATQLMLARSWEAIRIRVSSAHSAASARLRLLQEMTTESESDEHDIWEEGVRAYKEGVLVLGELVELQQIEEDRELARVRIKYEARSAVLDMYCSAGYFPEQAIDDLLSGANK